MPCRGLVRRGTRWPSARVAQVGRGRLPFQAPRVRHMPGSAVDFLRELLVGPVIVLFSICLV
eukprot:8273918-Pyramimonas_sp.AAC.1